MYNPKEHVNPGGNMADVAAIVHVEFKVPRVKEDLPIVAANDCVKHTLAEGNHHSIVKVQRK
jgi:hypothetical protein